MYGRRNKEIYPNTQQKSNLIYAAPDSPKMLLDPQTMHYIRRIQHALGRIFEESKQNRFLAYGCDKHRQETINDKLIWERRDNLVFEQKHYPCINKFFEVDKKSIRWAQVSAEPS